MKAKIVAWPTPYLGSGIERWPERCAAQIGTGIPMSDQVLDLEHRVEAQGEVIMALVAAIARENPDIIGDLRRLFANRHAQRVHVEGYPNTISYAEEVIATATRIHSGA